MVRIVSIPSLPQAFRASVVGGFDGPVLSAGPLARWLENDGFSLRARDCGDGTWAVFAEGRAASLLVANGLRGVDAALDWIRREKRLARRALRRLFAEKPGAGRARRASAREEA
jgi:hypothetical protein